MSDTGRGASECPTVWVLAITHRHGTDLYANSTEAGAEAELLAYVKSNWRDSFAGEETDMPSDPDGAIECYFTEIRPDEFYSLERTAVRE